MNVEALRTGKWSFKAAGAVYPYASHPKGLSASTGFVRQVERAMRGIRPSSVCSPRCVVVDHVLVLVDVALPSHL